MGGDGWYTANQLTLRGRWDPGCQLIRRETVYWFEGVAAANCNDRDGRSAG